MTAVSRSEDYLDVRARLLEPSSSHAHQRPWLTSTVRVLRGWGVPSEEDSLLAGVYESDQPGSRWDALDQEAKANRLHHYQRVRSPEEAKHLLLSGVTVQACFQINEDWFEAKEGLIDPSPSPVVGSHTVHLLHYKPKFDRFVFWNPWGEHWGHKGHGSFTSEYFTKYFVEGWVGVGCGVVPEYFQGNEPGTIIWESHGLCGEELYGRDVYDPTRDQRMAWSFAVRRGEFLDVEELFVKPEYRGRGHGRFLASLMRRTANERGLNLRFWIPFVDIHPPNLDRVASVAASVGLQLFPSDVSWSAYRATKHGQLTSIYLPDDDWSAASAEVPPLDYLPPAPRVFPEVASDPAAFVDSPLQLEDYQKSIDLILGRGDPL